jgi:rRNA maturation endonuclease Nob1
MIPITLPWFVFLYLALFLAGILILWIGYEMIRKRHANSIARDRVFCKICGSRYTDTSTADLLNCPACGSQNERSTEGGI